MPSLNKPLNIAQELDALGFNVLPVRPGQKAPALSEWKKWSSARASHMTASWFGGQASNYWIATGGISGVYVLDIDNDAADRWWRDVAKFGDVMDSTVRVKTAKGHHYYFHVPGNDMARGWSIHEQGIDFDIRGAGQGVVVPPSIHESGHRYEWVQAPDPDKPLLGMAPCPDWLKSLDGVKAHIASGGDDAVVPLGKPGKGSPSASPVELRGTTTSMLSALLGRPPEDGGRNDWLTKVAGHYAKTYRNQLDLYHVHVRAANQMLRHPLDEAEFTKTVDSIWASEQNNHPERSIESTGFLLSGGDTLLTQVKVGKGEDAVVQMQEWADFDLRVQGVVYGDGDQGNLLYDCLLVRKRDHAKIPVVLPGKVIGQPAKLHAWLAGYGVSISRPDNTWPSQPIDPVRLLRYLESQEAPQAKMVPALGWNDEADGFLTFDGVIRPDGIHGFEKVRPNPALQTTNVVQADYGFEGTLEEARAILAEVCSFHYPEVTAIFGGWWAACFLKPQLQRRVSLFPIMAIEAASGAGKTNGMFNLLMQLNGALLGPSLLTMASARDKIASHCNGIVWMDDMDSLGRIEELLRVTTSNESMVKKGFDNTGNVSVTLTAPVVVSGEYLGLGSQKALMDRVILLNPPKPDDRMSLKPGREDRPQWDDVVELSNRHPLGQGMPGLTVYAGHLVALALSLQDRAVAKLLAVRAEVKKRFEGRQADKVAIVLVGAWLLDRLIQDLDDSRVGPNEELALAWARGDDARSGSAGPWDNRLTTELVPWALREYDWPTRARPGAPVFVTSEDLTGTTVWVNASGLADAWSQHQRGRIVERTDTKKAILDQIARCQGTPRKRYFDLAREGSNRSQAMFWALTEEVADTVMARSQE